MWNRGDWVVLRGMVNGRVWSALSVIVVKDAVKETTLLLLPGAQCAYPEGYFRWKYGDYSQGTRWQEARSGAWALREFAWKTNRFLIILEPEKYYATFLIWHHDTDQFECAYINFQLPYRRTACGFDTLDLDLDLVVDPHFAWHWKDEEAYRQGIREGGIQQAWVNGVEGAKRKVLDKIRARRYPFDGSWLPWRPDPSWTPPRLRQGWDQV
jgi:hypothetical protein